MAPVSSVEPVETFVDTQEFGRLLFPKEFHSFTGDRSEISILDARGNPRAMLERLALGHWLVLVGPYAYVDAIYRYCQHHQVALVHTAECDHMEAPCARRAAFASLRRSRLYHLLIVGCGNALVGVDDAPDMSGFQDWLQSSTGDYRFLLPVRRLQRILTDVRRASNGILIPGLGRPITIFPHVYVPSDVSVPGMLATHKDRFPGKRVLDMGTGTGVLALLAACYGAASVVATDSNAFAVRNAAANVRLLGMESLVDVRGPASLFRSTGHEPFDLILFNAPWHDGVPHTIYDTAILDPGHHVLKGFLASAPNHLRPNGTILLQLSDAFARGKGDFAVQMGDLLACNGLRVAGFDTLSRLSRASAGRETVYLFDIRHNSPCRSEGTTGVDSILRMHKHQTC